MKALDIEKQNIPPSILFVGPAGSGKTALVSQASGGKLYDFDRGMRTALTLKDKFIGLRQKVEFETYMDDNPLQPTAFSRFKTQLELDMKLAASGKWPYNAIMLDSLTGLCESIHRYVMHLSGGAFKTPEIQHWGAMVNELEYVFALIRPAHVLTLVTAHEGSTQDKNGATSRIINSITARHGQNKIAWMFDEVLYTACKPSGPGKYAYVISGRAAGTLPIRTRSGVQDDIVHNDIGLAGFLSNHIHFTYGSGPSSQTPQVGAISAQKGG